MRRNDNIDSTIRLYLLSVLTGLFAGFFASSFRWVLQETFFLREYMFRHNTSIIFHILIIVGMWLVLMAVNWLKNNIKYIGGSGIPQSRAVIFGRIDFRRPVLQFISKFIGSASTIGIGLSLGREGPSVQIGALGSTIISRVFHSNPTEKRYLTTAGAGAGLSAAFSAPIASTIFIIEDTLGWVSVKVTLPVLIACIISSYCAHVMLPSNLYASVVPVAPDVNTFWVVVILAGLALLATIGGKLFNMLLFGGQRVYKKLKFPVWIKLLVIVLFTYIVGMFIIDLTAGGEVELIRQVISDNGNVWWLFMLVIIKILFTVVSYSAGLCGSLLLPLIVMGGLLGKAYALLLVQFGFIDPACCGYFTLIGMSVVFISVVRAPISGLMLILEMTTQYTVFFPMVLTGTLTFLFGQYMKIKPVYHKLYNDMFVDEKNFYSKVDFQVNNNSFLINKFVNELKLPTGCTIINIVRDNKNMPLTDELQIRDIITVKIPTASYSELFKVFRTLTNE